MCDLKCIFYIVGGEQACSNCLIRHENKITREEIEAQAVLYSQISDLAYEENTRHTKEEGRKTVFGSAELFQVLIKGDLEACKEYIVKQADNIYELQKEIEQLKKEAETDMKTGLYKTVVLDHKGNVPIIYIAVDKEKSDVIFKQINILRDLSEFQISPHHKRMLLRVANTIEELYARLSGTTFCDKNNEP